MAPNQIADRGCAHCGGGSSRREFLTTSAAAAAATLLAAACAGGAGDVAVTTGPVALTAQVSNYPALANVGGIAQINASGTPIAVVRTGTDTFSAFSLICPHRGCTVGITGSSFQCPCHGARFSSTGTWTGGQRTSNLYSLSTSYDSSTGLLTING